MYIFIDIILPVINKSISCGFVRQAGGHFISYSLARALLRVSVVAGLLSSNILFSYNFVSFSIISLAYNQIAWNVALNLFRVRVVSTWTLPCETVFAIYSFSCISQSLAGSRVFFRFFFVDSGKCFFNLSPLFYLRRFALVSTKRRGSTNSCVYWLAGIVECFFSFRTSYRQ